MPAVVGEWKDEHACDVCVSVLLRVQGRREAIESMMNRDCDGEWVEG